MQKQIKKVFFLTDMVLRSLMKVLIRFYQFVFSPDKSIFFRYWLAGRICRHHPHCSQYGYECFDQYNFFTACYRTMDRISRCTPGLTRSYDPVRYRVVFASGSPIGVPFLQALAADPRYDVVGVLTMPDMPSGRGMKMQENVIAIETQKLFFCHLEGSEADSKDLLGSKTIKDSSASVGMTKEEFTKKPHSLRLDSKKYSDEAKETYERLQSLDIDILYVVAYGNLLPQHILDIPKIAPINIHGSLLPAYRGASPLQTVFLDGLTETGITLMKMEAGLDSGPMIDKQIFKLGFADTVADLINRVKEYTPKWSLDSIDRYVHGELEEELQDETLVTHCGKIVKEDGLVQACHSGLDPESSSFQRCGNEFSMTTTGQDSLESIYRKYKAYYLWPKIFMKLRIKNEESKVVTIDELVIDQTLFEQYKDSGLFVDNGLLPSSQGQSFEYKLNPAIISLNVKPEGGKSMSWDDFQRGYIK